MTDRRELLPNRQPLSGRSARSFFWRNDLDPVGAPPKKRPGCLDSSSLRQNNPRKKNRRRLAPLSPEAGGGAMTEIQFTSWLLLAVIYGFLAFQKLTRGLRP